LRSDGGVEHCSTPSDSWRLRSLRTLVWLTPAPAAIARRPAVSPRRPLPLPRRIFFDRAGRAGGVSIGSPKELYLGSIGSPPALRSLLRAVPRGRRAGYLILAKHSFRRSSSKRTCDSMASCSAAVPLLENSAEAFLSRFCFQSRIGCLVTFWASDVSLTYVFMQASATEHIWHS
jgi:hypothetical protein